MFISSLKIKIITLYVIYLLAFNVNLRTMTMSWYWFGADTDVKACRAAFLPDSNPRKEDRWQAQPGSMAAADGRCRFPCRYPTVA